jgi:DNA polymerase zeta
MEPLSAFYNSPLVVLDFQSLYPSVMVAYNYCYSTCLGRVAPFKGQYKFGVAETDLPPGLLATLEDHITGDGTRVRMDMSLTRIHSCPKRYHVC